MAITGKDLLEKRKKKQEENKSVSGEDLINKLKTYRAADSNVVDQTYIDSFIKDAQSFHSSAEKDYSGVNWANASSVYDTRNSTYKDLSSRAYAIHKWLTQNKDNIDTENYKSFSSSINEFSTGLSSVDNAFRSARDFYGQFATEDDYNAWQAEEDHKQSILNSEDFKYYSEMGANIKNPENIDDPKSGLYQGEKVGNPVTLSREYATLIGMMEANGGDTAEYGLKYKYTFMDDNEVGVYNYYLAKYGEEKASEYLKSLDASLDQRHAGVMIQAADDTAMELLFSFGAGLEQFGSGLKNLDNLFNGTTPDNYTSVTTQAYHGMSVNNDGVWKVANDLANTTGNMLPSILVGSFTGGLGGALTMGASATGNAYSEMRNLGYSANQARAYAGMVGASEAALQYALGGISKLGGKAVNKVAGDLVAKYGTKFTTAIAGIDSAVARIAVKYGGQMALKMGSEAFEEATQSVLEPMFKSIVTGENLDIDWGEVAYSALLGGLSAGFLEGGTTLGGTIYNDVATTKHGQSLIDNNSVPELQSLARDMMGVSKETDMLSIKTNTKQTAHNVGELSLSLEKSVNSQNLTEVQNALVEKGLSKREAQRVAEKLLGSEKLSKKQMSNEAIKAVANELVNNPNSAINERNSSLTAARQGVSYKDGKRNSSMNKSVQTEVDIKDRVSADSKTTQVSTGEAITIDKNNPIAKTKDGKVYFNTDKGVVESADVTYANEAEGLIYESFVDLNPGFANALIKNYDGKMPVQSYIKGMREGVVLYGKHNFQGIGKDISNATYFAELSEADQAFALKLGRNLAEHEAKVNDAPLRQAIRNAAKKAEAEGKTTDSTKPKEVTFRYDENLKRAMAEKKVKLNPSQKRVVNLVSHLSKALGMNVVIYDATMVENEELRKSNGGYVPETNTLYLDLQNATTDRKTIAYSLSHELVHWLKAKSATDFNNFAKFLMEQYAAHGVDTATLLQNKMAKYESNADEAFEEMIADACETLLLDSNAVPKLMELRKADLNLFEKIMLHIRELIDKIRAEYKKYSPTSDEAKALLGMTDVLDQIYAKFEEAMVGATEASRSLEGVNMDFTANDAMSGTDLSDITQKPTMKLQEKTEYESFPKETIKLTASKADRKPMDIKINGKRFKGNASVRELRNARFEENGFDSKVVTKVNNFLDKMRDYLVGAREKYVYVGLQDIYDAKIIISPTTGNIVLSGLVNNGDYEINFDFTKTCKKKIALQEVIEQLAREKGVKNEDGTQTEINLSEENIRHINEVLAANGIETACLCCFVESKRYAIQSHFQEKVCDVWNRLVDEVNSEDGITKEAPYFNFADQNVNDSKIPEGEYDRLYADLERWRGYKFEDDEEGEGAVERKMKAFLINTPNARKKLRLADFVTESGRTNLHKLYPDIESLAKAKIGTALPKAIEAFAPYNGEIELLEVTDPEGIEKYVMKIAGARSQSFSDFLMSHVYDVLQKTASLMARKLTAHTYTKEISRARLFGMTGEKTNMSVLHEIDPNVDSWNAGLHEDGTYFVSDYEAFKNKKCGQIQSIPDTESIALQNTEGYSRDCGRIGVGFSYTHMLKMHNDPDIRQTIGYHSSSLPLVLKPLTNLDKATDYTPVQNTLNFNGFRKPNFDIPDGIPSYATPPQDIEPRFKVTKKGAQSTQRMSKYSKSDATFDIKGKYAELCETMDSTKAAKETLRQLLQFASDNGLALKTSKYDTGRADFDLYVDTEKTQNPYLSADHYIEYCISNGLIPMFYEFALNDNYYKDIYDFNPFDRLSYNPETGLHEDSADRKAYAPQRPVTMVNEDGSMAFPDDFWELVDKYMKDYNYQREDFAKKFPKIMKEVRAIKDAEGKPMVSKGDLGLKKQIKESETIEQKISSAKTSIAQIPALFKHKDVVFGETNVDIGGGRFDLATNYLAEMGTKNYVFDPYNRSEEVNSATLAFLQNGNRSDTATCANVLNVIAEEGARANVILEVAKAIKKDGTAYFMVYEGDSSGIGRETSAGWQNNRKTADYVGEISKYFESVTRKGKLIIAKTPVKNLPKATWEVSPGKGIKFQKKDTSNYAPTFYSHMGKVIDGIKMDKIGSASLIPFLKGKGVKDDEIKWSGIEAFLEGKKSVTKAELQEFVAGSQLEIVEQISDDEEHTRWGDYKLKGGSNYRELVFKLPNSSYSNNAMRGHWGEEGEGILAHARIQDMTTADGKNMLFIEEIQSDWHNEGQKTGYKGEDATITKAYETAREKYVERKIDQDLGEGQYALLKNDPEMLSKSEMDFIEGYIETLRKDWGYKHSIEEYKNNAAPDAPFRTTYHEYVLKRLLRMAAEEGYDSIGWTTADIQSERWSEDYAEGYRIEYDQDIPKFLRKYGKKWGATVGKTAIPSYKPSVTYYDANRQQEYTDIIKWQNDVEREIKAQGASLDTLWYEDKDTYWVAYDEVSGVEYAKAEIRKQSGSVWSMDITEPMKESVLYEGQMKFQKKDTEYLNAVNRGDMATAQRMVDEAAKAAGYDSPKLYHGTKMFGFTEVKTSGVEAGMAWSPFFAANKEDISASYVPYGKVRDLSSSMDEDAIEEAREIAIEERKENISELLDDFRSLIDRYFSPWVFGQTDNSYLEELVEEANPEPGSGDGVYDVLSEIVYDNFYDYQDELGEYEDGGDWIENSPEGQEIITKIVEIEGEKSAIHRLESGEELGGIYQLYANLDNMYIVDGKGVAWNELRPEGLPKLDRNGYKDVPYKTRDVAEWARDNGYDGVIFKNIRDNGAYGRTPVGDVYAFFRPESQVKSADPVTYDDDGKVIPLSERFNSNHKDIRFQKKEVSNRTILANALESTIDTSTQAGQNELKKLKEYQKVISDLEKEEAHLAEVKQQIHDISFTKNSDRSKLNALNDDKVKTQNRIHNYDKKLVEYEAMKPIKDVLAREKELVRKKTEAKAKEYFDAYREHITQVHKEDIGKERTKRREAVSKVRETRDKQEAKKKLYKLVLETIDWIEHPKKTDVKCPDMLKAPFHNFLKSINFDSERALKGGSLTKNDLRIDSAMNSLANTLEKLRESQAAEEGDANGFLDLPGDFVRVLRNMADDITDRMNALGSLNYVVNGGLNSNDIKVLTKLIRTLTRSIKMMNTLYANLRFANAQMLGVDAIGFLDSMGEAEKINSVKDFVIWDNALPYYAFKRFGKAGESIFEELMDAQDKMAYNAKKILDFKEKTWTDKEASEWGSDTHTIYLPSGGTVNLTTANAMGIYCLSRRDNGHGMNHLVGGGIRVVGLSKGATKAKDSRATLTFMDVEEIIDSLTPRQKQVAEAIQEFMSTVGSAWGNEISMKRFLTNDFTERVYYPIESDNENLNTELPEASQGDLYRLLNISATKALTEGANNRVIIRDIFDVFTNHMSDMARLNAYGMALLDYMKWLNYREKTVNDDGQIHTRGVRQSMNNTYGDKAMRYVLNLIKDINGRHTDNGDNPFLMKMVRLGKTASVGNNLRVAFLQFTSYPRAAMILSNKSLALGLTKVPNIKKAEQYCGVALWKSFGFYDTNIARSIEDQIKGATNIRQKIIELSMTMPGLADAITWGALWNACEYEVAKTTKNTVGSEEFNQAVGKKLREVVYATQVVDSVLTRSQIMRSKSGLTQMATAYMSEPTLTANLLMDAGFQFEKEKRITGSPKTAWKNTRKIIFGAVGNYCVLQLLTSLAESLADAWRDDEDEEFGEKFKAAFIENSITNIIPFNKIPIISDIAETALSILGIGYASSDNMATSWLTQIADAINVWAEVLGKEESSKTVYNAIFKTAKALSSVTGVSVSGAMREVVSLWNNTVGAYDSTLKLKLYESTNAELGNELYEAILEGDERQANSLREQFEDEDAINSALRKVIGDKYKEGTLSRSEAIDMLVEHGDLDDDEAYWKLKEWDYFVANGTTDDYSKYTEFYEAVKTGRNLKAVIKEHLDHGAEAKDLASQITKYYKPLYKEMSNSERASLKGYLLNAYSLLGYNRIEKSKDIDNWLKD